MAGLLILLVTLSIAFLAHCEPDACVPGSTAAHPTDPSSYLYCDNNQKNLTFSCGSQQHFNSDTSKCEKFQKNLVGEDNVEKTEVKILNSGTKKTEENEESRPEDSSDPCLLVEQLFPEEDLELAENEREVLKSLAKRYLPVEKEEVDSETSVGEDPVRPLFEDDHVEEQSKENNAGKSVKDEKAEHIDKEDNSEQISKADNAGQKPDDDHVEEKVKKGVAEKSVEDDNEEESVKRKKAVKTSQEEYSGLNVQSNNDGPAGINTKEIIGGTNLKDNNAEKIVEDDKAEKSGEEGDEKENVNHEYIQFKDSERNVKHGYLGLSAKESKTSVKESNVGTNVQEGNAGESVKQGDTEPSVKTGNAGSSIKKNKDETSIKEDKIEKGAIENKGNENTSAEGKKKLEVDPKKYIDVIKPINKESIEDILQESYKITVKWPKEHLNMSSIDENYSKLITVDWEDLFNSSNSGSFTFDYDGIINDFLDESKKYLDGFRKTSNTAELIKDIEPERTKQLLKDSYDNVKQIKI